MESTNNITKFYNQTLKDSNVIDVNELKQRLEKFESFDWEEFNKPFEQVDMQKVVASIPMDQLQTEWKQPTAPQGNGKKQVKSAIVKYAINKGDVLGIGKGNNRGSVLILRNLKSKFSTHSYTFGEEKLKSQLQMSFEEILGMKSEMEYRDFKKLVQASVSFDIASESKQFQSPEALEQLKYLQLLKEVIGYQIGKEQDPNHSIPEHKITGFLQTKYQDYYQEDVSKLTVHMNVMSPYENDPTNKVSIVLVENPDGFCEGDVQPIYVDDQCKNVSDYLQLLKMKTMDIVVAIDSCCTKKAGRELQIMPKLRVLQVILKENQKRQQKHIGLRLIRNVASK